MARNALFAGLVMDEFDRPAEVGFVGAEPCYIVDDAGFRVHIPSEKVDRQVLQEIKSLMSGHEDLLSAEAAKMLGSDDPFSKAIIENQLKNIDKQFEMLFDVGVPEEMRAYLGMTGFKVIINLHGDVLEVRQAGPVADDDDDGDDE
jgi:hypothetical protein